MSKQIMSHALQNGASMATEEIKIFSVFSITTINHFCETWKQSPWILWIFLWYTQHIQLGCNMNVTFPNFLNTSFALLPFHLPFLFRPQLSTFEKSHFGIVNNMERCTKPKFFSLLQKKYPLKENIHIMNFLLGESEQQNWVTLVQRIQHELNIRGKSGEVIYES